VLPGNSGRRSTEQTRVPILAPAVPARTAVRQEILLLESVIQGPAAIGLKAGLASPEPAGKLVPTMREMKDTRRALVRIGYDGRVHKTFRGHQARERFENEVRILRHLEEKGCDFVPQLLRVDPEHLKIVTTSCGQRVDHLPDARVTELFAQLEPYGVRHDDPAMRNVTYRISDGRFCLIDFELATLVKPTDSPAPA
jgi:hypothetical protein